MSTEQIPVFPIARYDIGPLPAHQMIAFRPHYLSHLSQRPDEAVPSRYYALTAAQALAMIEDLQKAVQTLASSGSSGQGDLPTH